MGRRHGLAAWGLGRLGPVTLRLAKGGLETLRQRGESD